MIHIQLFRLDICHYYIAFKREFPTFHDASEWKAPTERKWKFIFFLSARWMHFRNFHEISLALWHKFQDWKVSALPIQIGRTHSPALITKIAHSSRRRALYRGRAADARRGKGGAGAVERSPVDDSYSLKLGISPDGADGDTEKTVTEQNRSNRNSKPAKAKTAVIK